MGDVVAHLAYFARGQLATLGDRGRAYMDRCYVAWTEKYGADVVLRIKHAVDGVQRKGA